MSARLLLAAVEVVKEQGDQVVEGYPAEPKTGRMPAVYAFTGLSSTFEKAGFVEWQRRSPSSPIMRLCLGDPGRGESSRGAT